MLCLSHAVQNSRMKIKWHEIKKKNLHTFFPKKEEKNYIFTMPEILFSSSCLTLQKKYI